MLGNGVIWRRRPDRGPSSFAFPTKHFNTPIGTSAQRDSSMKIKGKEFMSLVREEMRLARELKKKTKTREIAGGVLNHLCEYVPANLVDASIETLKKLTNADHLDDAFFYKKELGNFYLSFNRVREAEAIFNECIEERPENPLPQRGIAIIRAREGKLDQARAKAKLVNASDYTPAHIHEDEIEEERAQYLLFLEQEKVWMARKSSIATEDASAARQDGSPTEAIALTFAELLIKGEFSKAHDLISPAAQSVYPINTLKKQHKTMTAYLGRDSCVADVLETMTDWPAKRDGEVEWLYVAIMGDSGSEGISVVVRQQDNQYSISSVEWGRP